jgi:protein-S-isoprenylcysteine O-methyltransferase Ste14
MKWLVILMELVAFSSFGWALWTWFSKVSKPKGWEASYIKINAHIWALANLLAALSGAACKSLGFTISGLALLLISICLFWWTIATFKKEKPAFAFSQRATARLITSGTYAIVRHPLYTAYTLTWIGGTIATQCWWLSLSLLFMFPVYRRAAILEERDWLGSELSQDYKSYMALTGRFLPGLK